MREVKFRAWSNDHNRYCDFVTLDENGKWVGWVKSSGVYLTTTDIVLEQYTGLKDKNGKEIYEGDIVKFCSDSYEVKFDTMYDKDCDAGCYLCWLCENKHRAHSLYDAQYDLEVVGNIHENPELLGGYNA